MTALPTPATVLAFDFGTRRIGVAVGNTLTRAAQPLMTIDGQPDETRDAGIAALLAEWQPDVIVVGIPVHADGTPHAMTAQAERFATWLSDRFGIAVARADERYTTQAAQAALDEAGAGRRGRVQRDQVAAQFILQGWLDELGVADS